MEAILKERQMDDMPVEKQAAKALSHLLTVMRENPAVAYYCGPGTQTFSLATEAAAALFGHDLEQVRKNCINPRAADPAAGRRELLEACQRIAREHERTPYDISVGAIEDAIEAVKIAEGRDE